MTEQRRSTKEPASRGDDPRQTDADQYDEDRVEHLEQHRPVTNDQADIGERGVSSDRPGVDAGGYPERPRLKDREPTEQTDTDSP